MRSHISPDFPDPPIGSWLLCVLRLLLWLLLPLRSLKSHAVKYQSTNAVAFLSTTVHCWGACVRHIYIYVICETMYKHTYVCTLMYMCIYGYMWFVYHVYMVGAECTYHRGMLICEVGLI